MKKLIFCFDGTCNSPSDADDYVNDVSITNILKLHLFFGGKLPSLYSPEHVLQQPEKDLPQGSSKHFSQGVPLDFEAHKVNQSNEKNNHNSAVNVAVENGIGQHSFYYSGIGTRGNWFKRLFNAAFAPPYGEMKDILAEAQTDLAKHYQPADEIYIFGFSRGAAIARVFAAQLKESVKFLGVFDTVAATKGSLDLNPYTFPASGIIFENDILGSHIEQAVHLVALDEQRLTFQPTLFNKDERIQEVWFAGTHSDIGGGYWFDGLSDICLNFMLDSLQGKLRIIPVEDIIFYSLNNDDILDVIDSDDLKITPLVNGKLHSQERSFSQLLTLAPRIVRVNVNNDTVGSAYLPLIHYTVAERFKKVDSYRPIPLFNKQYQLLMKNHEKSKPLSGVSDLSA